MTPRESLEAAGWTPANNYAIWWHVNSNGWITQAEALARLARDKSKETSDGDDGTSSAHLDGDDRTSPLDTVVPDKAAPVATSVSAPPDDVWPLVEEYYDEFKASLDSEIELEPFDKWCECPVAKALIKFYVAGASSSSAAPDILTRILRSDMEQFSAEAERLHTENIALRDSRDRLQEEFDVMRLRALSAEKIARIPIRTQDEEFIARRAALGDPK